MIHVLRFSSFHGTDYYFGAFQRQQIFADLCAEILIPEPLGCVEKSRPMRMSGSDVDPKLCADRRRFLLSSRGAALFSRLCGEVFPIRAK
jgi:hypothetical protein